MKRPTPLHWISFGLVSLTFSILMMSDLAVNLIPDEAIQVFDYRKKYSEALAIQYSLLAEKGDGWAIQEALSLLVQRNEDIESVALVLASGETVGKAGPHSEVWVSPPGQQSTSDHIQVPIYNANELWGTLQVRFQSLGEGGWFDLLDKPWVRFILLVMASGFFGYFLYMKRTLRQLDPSSVVPMRVKTALDVLEEGVVMLDNEERIVLANRAFGKIAGQDSGKLMGKKLSEFRWESSDPETPLIPLPWVMAKKDKSLKLHFPLMLPDASGKPIKFQVNCTPITDDRGWVRGLLVSFSDVTQLEETIDALEASKAELESLAMHDPLTGCFNRRALFEALEDQLNVGQELQKDLGCIMTDIDHFKSFNDQFGHAVGDQVIKVVADILTTTIRPTDILGRYGGEEFCVLLPGRNSEETAAAAERLRQKIEEFASKAVRTTSGQPITMSFGVTALSLGASDSLELVDQADKALYAAKQGGRNQVCQWTEKGLERNSMGSEKLVGSGSRVGET